MKNKIKIIIVFMVFLLNISCVLAINETNNSEIVEDLNTKDLFENLKEYTKDTGIDLDTLKEKLVSGETIDYGKIGNYILDKLFLEVKNGIKASIQIIIVLIFMAVISSLELENNSSVSKVAYLVGILIIITIIIKSYSEAISLSLDAIYKVTSIVQIISPFILSLLMLTGEITTSGIIGPIILFVASLVYSIITVIIIPLMTVSLIFNIITSISKEIKLEKFASFCNSSVMWVISILLTVFLSVLELQSMVTTSVDKLTVKTAETAVSNVVPVVGKFVADSLEIVIGSTEIILKSVGVIGIILIVLVVVIPIIKLVVLYITYYFTSCLSEMLDKNSTISKLLESISKEYKLLIGILSVVTITFVIALAIVIKLIGKIYS